MTTADALATPQNNSGVFSFKQLMELELTRPKDIIEGILYERQRVLFSGEYGIGKTMFWLMAGLCLAGGRSFLGRKIPRAYRVMFLDCENDLGDVQHRIRKQIEHLQLTEEQRGSLTENWLYVRANSASSEYAFMELEKEVPLALSALLEQSKAEIVVVDNLGLVTGTELEKPDEVKKFYANVKKLMDKTPTLLSTVFLHHLTKPREDTASLFFEPRKYMARTRGSGRLLDYAEGRFAIASEEFGGEQKIVVNGINRTGIPTPLVLDLNTDTLSFQVADERRARFEYTFSGSSKKRHLFDLLSSEPFSFTQATEIIDPERDKSFSRETVDETLKLGRKCGSITYDKTAKLYRKVVM